MDNETAVSPDSTTSPPCIQGPLELPQAGPIAGELVTKAFDYDGGRYVTVYVPPGPAEAVVFAGEGQWTSQLGGYLEAAGVPPTMVVGVHGMPDVMGRLNEYSLAFDEQRFNAHERFFVETVREWVRSRFGVAPPAARTAVLGIWAAAELSLAMGVRHPEIYGAVFCGMPGGGYRPPGVLPSPFPRTYLVASTQDEFFLENTTRWAVALREAGADVVMRERAADANGPELWIEEVPLFVAWAFGR